MYRHKPVYYLKRLIEKGWTNEEICKKTRISAIRIKKLYLPATVCSREEIKKINALFRLTSPANTESVKKIWAEDRGPKKEHHVVPDLTERQREVLQQLRDSQHKEVNLSLTEAKIAGRLVTPGLVSKRIDSSGDDSLRFYSITSLGIVALKGLGI